MPAALPVEAQVEGRVDRRAIAVGEAQPILAELRLGILVGGIELHGLLVFDQSAFDDAGLFELRADIRASLRAVFNEENPMNRLLW